MAIMKNYFNPNDLDAYFTFMNISGATSISFDNKTVAKMGEYYCYIDALVLKARASSIDSLKVEIIKLTN